MKTVAVVGAGQMGAGISQVCASRGHQVILVGRTQERVGVAKARIEASLSRLVAKDKITAEERDVALRRVEPTTRLGDIAAAEVIIETVTEREDVKFEVLRACGRAASSGALFATNTSSISITRLARAVPDASRFVGLHFFNPAPLMGLIEVVRGLATSEETVAEAAGFAETLGKVAVQATDSPGFVVNRLLIPMLNEAVFALSEGVASMTAIDAAVKLGLNHPMGPLTLADFIGLDICLEICRVLYAGTGDQKFRPAPLLVNYVEAGWLGRKTGKGFYDYSGPEPVPTR